MRMAGDRRHGGLKPAAPSVGDLLRLRAETQPHDRAYVFLRDGEIEDDVITWAELDRRSRAIAVALRAHAAPGSRALLLYPAGLEFIAAFFGCLYAGVIAVPAPPPFAGRAARGLARVQAIALDAEAAVVLTTTIIRDRHREAIPGALWMASDSLDVADAARWTPPEITGDTLAFLQYTSGSTGAPRGVQVSHANLWHNLGAAFAIAHPAPAEASVSWLPVTHDMGLIEGVLQPAFRGHSAILMAPTAFLQRPVRWVQAISRYRAARSGGPNFAYDLCARKVTPDQIASLDLRCWRDAYNGAEPVRADTLAAFAARFAPAGFRASAFRPCYGLAEATLVVASDRWNGDTSVRVSCGSPVPGMDVRIVHPEMRTTCVEGAVGEIWVRGPSVASGYWRQPPASALSFNAWTVEGDGPFLRTGDLGYLHARCLIVTGRLKDVLIVRGTKLFPQDLEYTAESSHPAIRAAGTSAVSARTDATGDCIVLAAEVDPRRASTVHDADEIIEAIRSAIHDTHGVQLHAVALLPPGGVPKTTSGKTQRYLCRDHWIAGLLPTLAVWHLPAFA